MNSMFTYMQKLYTTGYSLFISLLCFLGSQTAVLGLSLPTSFNTIDEKIKIRSDANQPIAVVSSATQSAVKLASPGSVSAVEASKCYRLVSRLSGKVLGISGTAQNDGDGLTQQTDATKLTQGWKFTATDGGYYSITTLSSTQKGLEVTNSSTADDALLEQWTYWGGSHQQWRLVRNAEGYFTLINRNSNKAITVRNASTAEGALISQMTLGTGQNQQWSIVERSCTATPTTNQAPVAVATSTSLTGSSPLSVTFTGNKSYDPDGDQLFYEWAFSDGTYLNEANPVKVFTTQTGQHGSGTITNYTAQLTVTDSKGLRSTGQIFTISLTDTAPTAKITSPVNNGKYSLDKATSYTLAATVTNANANNSLLWQVKLRRGNHDQLVKTTSGNNAAIDISPVGCDGQDTYYVITLTVTGIGGSSSVKDSVKIYPDCNSSKLTITGLTATTVSSSSVRLNWTNPSIAFDKVLVVGGTSSGLTDIPLEPTYTANASFTGNGSDIPAVGKVLYQGTSTSVVVTDLTAGQPYYFRVYVRSGNGWSGGVEVSATPTSATSSPGSVSAVEASKCYRLVSRLSGKVLGISGTAQNDGDGLTQQTDATTLTQGWKFTATDGGYYSITTLSSTQKGLEVTNSSTADDALLEQWTYWGGSHQQWRLVRNAEGYFTLINRNSNKAITVRNASTAEGALISQLTLGTGQNQQWSIVERTCPTGARLGTVETVGAFKLWPNPAHDHVRIDLSPAAGQSVGLQLNDLMGRSLEQMQLEAAPAEPYRFNTSQLPNGLYLMQLTPAGQSPTTLRLLIQR